MSEPENGTSKYRLAQLEMRIDKMEERNEKRFAETAAEHKSRFGELDAKLDRLTLAIVGGSITVAVSVIVFTVTYLASAPP